MDREPYEEELLHLKGEPDSGPQPTCCLWYHSGFFARSIESLWLQVREAAGKVWERSAPMRGGFREETSIDPKERNHSDPVDGFPPLKAPGGQTASAPPNFTSSL